MWTVFRHHADGMRREQAAAGRKRVSGYHGWHGHTDFGKTGTRRQDWHPVARLAPDGFQRLATHTCP